MRIAHLLPTSAVFPLKKHNGRYEWALRLARLQAEQGHEVTMFCGEGSHDDSAISWRHTSANSESKRDNNISLISEAYTENSFDVYHSHFDSLAAELSHLTDRPVVTTQHWFPDETIARRLATGRRQNVVAVPVTHLMQQTDETLGINHADFIYHGIDLELFRPTMTPVPEQPGYLLFVGRIHPAKGVREAVDIALATGKRLLIIGKVNHSDEEYWNTFKDLIDGKQIHYLGQKDQDELVAYMSHASCLLFPSIEVEAFGQVTVEAQACGLPVVISDVGASSELIVNEKTGFIVHDQAEFINAVHRLAPINREACRSNATRFSIHDMVQKYTSLYESLTAH